MKDVVCFNLVLEACSIFKHILFFSIKTGLENAKKDSGRINEQLKKEETLLRQYQSREDDLREVLTAKDSQLAVLRIRIQESDQELQETKTKLTKFQNENER